MILFEQTIPLYIIALICGILSFSTTLLSMPRLIRKLKNADIVGKDIHKTLKPIVPEMGGIGILFGFIRYFYWNLLTSLFNFRVINCSYCSFTRWNNWNS